MIGIVCQAFVTFLQSAVRSALSKLVPSEEFVNLFTVLQIMESIANLIGTTLGLVTLKHTLRTHPGTIYQVLAGWSGVSVLLLLVYTYGKKKLNF